MPVLFLFRPAAHAAGDAEAVSAVTAALVDVTGVPPGKVQVFCRPSLSVSASLDAHLIDGPQVDEGKVTRALGTALRGVHVVVRVYPPEHTARGGRLRPPITHDTEEERT